MLPDVTIDANVLAHADDPRQTWQGACCALIERLLAAETKLCVDEGFDLDESKNRSRIAFEYLAHLRFGSPGYTFVHALASSGRLCEVSRGVAPGAARVVKILVHDRRDRLYVSVTLNSESLVLYSNDTTHFPPACNRALKKRLGVSVRSTT